MPGVSRRRVPASAAAVAAVAPPAAAAAEPVAPRGEPAARRHRRRRRRLEQRRNLRVGSFGDAALELREHPGVGACGLQPGHAGDGDACEEDEAGEGDHFSFFFWLVGLSVVFGEEVEGGEEGGRLRIDVVNEGGQTICILKENSSLRGAGRSCIPGGRGRQREREKSRQLPQLFRGRTAIRSPWPRRASIAPIIPQS